MNHWWERLNKYPRYPNRCGGHHTPSRLSPLRTRRHQRISIFHHHCYYCGLFCETKKKTNRCWLKEISMSFSQQKCVNQMSFGCSLRSDFDKLCRFKALKEGNSKMVQYLRRFLHSDEQIPLRLMTTKQIIFCQMMIYTLAFHLWCKTRIHMRTPLKDT